MGLTVVVFGNPAPQGSKKFVGVKHGRGVMVESSGAVKPWREAVKGAALRAIGSAPPLAGPIVLEATFTLRKPASAPKRRKSYPDRKPDLSKLIRSTEDALTDAGVWEDDARVVETYCRKVFPGEHEDALRSPGAVIRIGRVSDLEGDLLPLTNSPDEEATSVA